MLTQNLIFPDQFYSYNYLSKNVKVFKMKYLLLLIFSFSLCRAIHAQEHFNVNGLVVDGKTNLPLSFSNIRVAESALGTATNKDGQFNLKLKKGNYNLIASFIGYISDTIVVELVCNISNVKFNLTETKINLPEVVITPGINPALEIIRKAMVKKKEREEKILSYEFDAYTKGSIRTEDDLQAGRNSVSLGIGSSDSSELKITGILENQSKGFYKKPDDYKEIILARKQSANFPPSINVLSGGRLIQNFYSDDVNFFGRDVPGPLAENALEYYDYFLEETFGLDNTQVFKIFMTTINRSDPGFEGNIFINANTFDLAKVNLQLNKAANFNGLFDTVNVFQQFSVFDDSISMPVDYRLFANANYLGLARFGFEINTILYDYKLNDQLDENIFDKAIVTVLPDADKKDSSFWQNIQTIPNTTEEEIAYLRIDSLKNVPQTFWDNFSILSPRMQLNDNLSVSAPISMYHFNPVEGHALDYGFFIDDLVEERLNSSLNFSYGFANKKLKTDFLIQYLLGNYRTTELNFGTFNKTKILFGESDNYNELTSTLLALLSKYSFRDYYYSKGFSLGISGEVLPILRLGVGFENLHDRSAVNNSDFSFFAKDKMYRANKTIDNVKVNAITATFKIDFRDYIEDRFYRRRVNTGKTFFTLEGSMMYSNSGFLKSDVDFNKYDFTFYGTINSFRTARFDYKLYGFYNNGKLPFQLYYAVPGNFDLASKNFSFRTLQVNEVISDRAVSLNLEYNFRDELFKLLGIPGLKDWGIQLNTFLNIMYSNPSDDAKFNTLLQSKSYLLPFYETGFSIGHVLVPIQIEFAWKLNYLDENNFRIGINTFIL